MPKVRKKMTRKEKERLSREAGIDFKPVSLNQKKNNARPSAELPQPVRQFEKAATLPLKKQASVSMLIDAGRRNSPDAMVTGAYLGGAVRPVVFASVSMPSLENPKLVHKPCFLLADIRDNKWQITRFTGDLTPEGKFCGAEDSIFVGPVNDSRIRRALFTHLINWAQGQGIGKLDRLPQKVFGPAQNIYGLDQRPGPVRRFDR